MSEERNYEIGGIPVIVSAYAERDSLLMIPLNGRPVIIPDSLTTVAQKMEAWLRGQDEQFLRNCGIIYNIGRGR